MPKEKRTIAWTAEEEDRLRESVGANSKGDEISWVDVAVRLPYRTDEQCRKRWAVTNKMPEKDGECMDTESAERWTKEEDEVIISNRARLGNQWAEISNFLDGRTENCVKNRWQNVLRRRVDGGEAEDGKKRKLSTPASRKRPAKHYGDGDEGSAGVSSVTTTAKTTEQRTAKESNGRDTFASACMQPVGYSHEQMVPALPMMWAPQTWLPNGCWGSTGKRSQMMSNEVTNLNPEQVNENHKSGGKSKQEENKKRNIEEKESLWTAEEDRLIISNHAQLGNQWEEISTFLDGRTGNCVQNRWYSVLKRKVDRKRKAEEKEWSSSFVTLTVSPGRLCLSLQMSPAGGAEITEIDPSGPFNGQIQIGDRILTVDGNKVRTIEDVQAGADRVRNIGIYKRRPASEEYCRILMTSDEITDLNPKKIDEKYESRDEDEEAKTVTLTVSPGRLGLTLRMVPAGGAEITNIDPPCPFYGRLRIGDRIAEVDGRNVRTTEDVRIGGDRVRNIRFYERRRGNDEHCGILSQSEPPPPGSLPARPQFARDADAPGNVAAAPPVIDGSAPAAGHPNLSVLGAIGSGRLAKEKRAALLYELLMYDKNAKDENAQAFEYDQVTNGEESLEGQRRTKEEDSYSKDEGLQGNMDAGGGHWC